MNELIANVGFGFLGGLILNIMPCVLPVLTMKVFHVVQHSSAGDGSSDRVRKLHGVAYTAGILASFTLLASVVVALKAAGQSVGWGMQFQNPAFVGFMTALVFAFGLNALGVFEWSVSMSGRPGHQGYAGSFASGILSAVMSTPCSAPFLGTAASFALGNDTAAWQTFTMFLAIGLGLASPFLAVSFVPKVGKALPKPGPWMETFKQLMGFTLLGATVWLMRVVQAQLTADAANDFLIFLLILGICLWGVHRFGGIMHGALRRYAVRAIALALTIAAALQFASFDKASRRKNEALACAPTTAVVDGKIAWAAWDTKRIASETSSGRLVFVDYTAEWCANCKTNEKLFLETAAVRKALVDTGALAMKADWTDEDDEIRDWLDKLGRKAVPAYAIYTPDGGFDLLPEAITSQMVVDRLRAAVKKFPPKQAAKGG